MSVCIGGDGNNSHAQGFVGPAALADHRGYCIHDRGAILIGHRGCRALVQEGLPLVFLTNTLLVCRWCWSSVYAAPSSPIFALNFKSGAVVTGVVPRRSRSLTGGGIDNGGASGAPYGDAGVEVADADPPTR
jgi:hypothetical protein